MAIDIGDAVLTFLGDTTQLDQTMNKVNTQVPVSMGAATGAIEGTSAAVQGMSKEMAVGMSGAVELGSVVNLAGETSRESLYQARGEAQLLGEAFGVHLPRHVRSFMAELPGVGVALSAAFQATAVLFIIEAIATAIERVIEWTKQAEKVDAAWREIDKTQQKVFESLENDLLKAQIKTAELTNNHMEALRLKLQLIDNTSLSKLEAELEKIAATADRVFKDLEPNFFQKLYGFDAIDEVKKKFKDITGVVVESLSPRTPEAYSHALKILDDNLAEIQKKINELAAKDKPVTVGGFVAPGVDPQALKSWDELHVKLEQFKKDIKESQAAEQLQKKDTGIEEKKKAADAAIKAAKEEFQVYKDLFAAREAAEKQLEKQQEAGDKSADVRLKQELKAEEEASKEKLRLLKQQEEAAIAALDGEMKVEEATDERKAELLRNQYDRGLLTGKQYLQALAVLQQQEVQNLLQMLNRKEQLVILEAQNEAASRGKILSTEEAKELKGFVEIENKKAAIQSNAAGKLQKEEDKILAKQAKTYNSLSKQLDDYSKHLRAAQKDLTGFGKVADGVLGDLSQAFGAAIEQWVMGQKSFGAALQDAVKQYLAQLAAKSAAEALYWTAYGFAMLAMWDFEAAGHAFTAAAEFAAGAVVAGGIAKGMGGGGSSSSASAGGSSASVDKGNPANQPGQQPVQVINAQHLGGGGLADTPRMALIGDRREAIVPLDRDSRALDEIAERVLEGMGGQGGGNHFHFPRGTFISPDNLNKVVRKMDRQVKRGGTRFTSSNSYRITKRG